MVVFISLCLPTKPNLQRQAWEMALSKCSIVVATDISSDGFSTVAVIYRRFEECLMDVTDCSSGDKLET